MQIVINEKLRPFIRQLIKESDVNAKPSDIVNGFIEYIREIKSGIVTEKVEIDHFNKNQSDMTIREKIIIDIFKILLAHPETVKSFLIRKKEDKDISFHNFVTEHAFRYSKTLIKELNSEGKDI